MNLRSSLRSWMHVLLHRPRFESDMDAELRAHIEAYADDLMRTGVSREEGLRRARLEFGGLERVKEECRESRGISFIESTLQDLRFAFRTLRKSPGFTVVAILTLALGIGANTAVFSMADAFLIRPLSLPGANRLVALSTFEKGPASAADYLDWKTQGRSFKEMAAYRQDDMNLAGASTPERVYGSLVTPDFFSTLGVQPALGRAFSTNEGESGHSQVAILSYGLWQQRFAADPHILGKSVEVDGQQHTIIGIMPKNFDFPVPSDLWLPLALTPASRAGRAHRNLEVVARLNRGVSLGEAQSEMALIAHGLAQAYPVTNKNVPVRVTPLIEFVEGSITRSYIFMFLIAAGIVLLIVASNIANLQLARSTTRQKEIAVRIALGARRWRIIRLLLVENLLLGILGGAASIGLAVWALNALASNMPADVARLIPGWYEIRVNAWALVFTLAIAILSGLLTGLMPAWSVSRAAINEALKESSATVAGGSRPRQRLRQAFVVAQIVVALVLVVSAMLMVKGFGRLAQTQQSYDGSHVLVMSINLTKAQYPTQAARALFFRETLGKLAAIPGVRSAGTFYTIPLSNNGTDWRYFQIEGQTTESAARRPRSPAAVLQTISPGYFSMLHIPLTRGRTFTEADVAASQPVAIVSQNLANYYWPGKNAIGQHIKLGKADDQQPWITVVGVAGNVLYDWTDQLPESAIYVPSAQLPPAETFFAIRTDADAGPFAQSAGAAIASIDPRLPVFNVMPLSDAIHGAIVGIAYVADMMATLGFIALLIALVGVYGVMAFAVAERTHEFGVRMALGARPRDVLWLVLRRGAWLAAAGIVIGLPLAVAVARVLAGLIFGAAATDWTIFTEISALVVVVIAAACYIPARRAMRVDPIVALRYE